MGKTILKAFGRLKKMEIADPEMSQRIQQYVGLSGAIELHESEKLHPGWRYVYFFPSDDFDKYEQRYFHTSTSEYIETESGFMLIAPNGDKWWFEFDGEVK